MTIYRDDAAPRAATSTLGSMPCSRASLGREFYIVAAWSVCRLGRSLCALTGLLGELQARDIDLYVHQRALDTSTPSGRMLFGMLSVFSEFERTKWTGPVSGAGYAIYRLAYLNQNCSPGGDTPNQYHAVSQRHFPSNARIA